MEDVVGYISYTSLVPEFVTNNGKSNVLKSQDFLEISI